MAFHVKEKLLSFVLCTAAFAVFFACEKQLPDEFQKEEGFTFSGPDSKACSFLSQDTTKTDTVIVGEDTTYTTIKLYHPVSSVPIQGSADSVWANAADSLLQFVLDTLVTDKMLLVANPQQSDVTYAAFIQQSGGDKNLIFYFSWDLTGDNLDAYFETTLYNRDGEPIKLSSNDMSLESIAGCTAEVESGGQTIVVPKIRARYLYRLPEGTYLVRLYNSDPLSTGKCRMVILDND